MRAPASRSKYLLWVISALLGVVFVWELVAPNSSPLLYPALVTLAALACILSVHRQLPLQNIISAAVITGFIGGMAHGLSANPGFSIPFGPIVFDPASGVKIFNSVPWTIPLLWIVAVFASRGVARLILRPWRKTKNYGWWLIGLAAVLVVAFDFALEPFARAKHLWVWRQTKIDFTWQGATVVDFLGWLCVTLLILAFITPSLIKKQPGSSPAPDLHPLIVWLGALLLFAVGSAQIGFWPSVVADGLIASVTLFWAVRGARW